MIGEPLVYRPKHPSANENGMVPKSVAGATPSRPERNVYVIGDVMDPLKHMGTGRIHDSKSNFRADTKATGCVEVGNDPAALRDDVQKRTEVRIEDVVQDVKRSIAELNSR